MNKKEKALELARAIALFAHDGQVDKLGVDYYKHPEAVAAKCTSLDSKTVAYLHDVVEDTSISLDILKGLGFENDIVEAVRCLTKEAGYDEEDYIRRIKNNSLARQVKLADLEHNSDIDRINSGTDEVKELLLKKREHYLEMIKKLND